MKIGVKVSEEFIARGVRASHTACPIALALRAETGQGDWHVEMYVVWREGEKGNPYAKLTHEAGMFIRNFDDGRPVEPFYFEIEVPG